MKIDKKPLSVIVSALSLGLLGAPAVSAQGMLEEVIVTAQKRDEVQTDVPITITALSAERLETSNFVTVNDLPTLVPALRIDASGAFSQATVRGVGSSTAGVGFTSNVATYVDGFYIPSQATTNMQLANLRNVEVLKGPQGTLFGRNATGGAILLTMADPSFETTGKIRASAGSFNRTNFAAYGSTGLTETLAADISGYWERHDGWVDNIVTGSDDDGEVNRRGIRVAGLWQATDGISFELAADHHDWDDANTYATGVYEGQAIAVIDPAWSPFGAVTSSDPERVANDGDVGFSSQVSGVYLTSRFDLGELELTSFTMYREEVGRHVLDLDSSSMRLFHSYFDIDNRAVSQEFNLAGNAFNDRLDWIVGLYYLDVTEEYTAMNVSSVMTDGLAFPGGPVLFPAGGYAKIYDLSAAVKTYAAFTDMNYELSDRWTLTFGARYSYEKADGMMNLLPPLGAFGSSIGVTKFDDDWSSFTPRGVIAYKPTDASQVYFSVSKGFKAGQVSPSSLLPASNNFQSVTVEPEEIIAYELGYKISEGSYRFDAALFYYDYEDLQMASYDALSAVVSNAASATIYGAEVQGSVALTDALTVNVGAAYVESEYDEYDNAPFFSMVQNPATGLLSYVDVGADASGNDMQRAPKFTTSIGFQYEMDVAGGSLSFNGDYYYTTKFYFDPANTFEQDAYGLLNLSATWRDPSDTWSLMVFGKNVLDEEYYAQVLPGAYAYQATWGAPAHFGVTIGYDF